LLTSAPILRIIDLDADFVVFMNACKEGLDGFLSQNGHVVCYESRNLKEHERLYATDDLELESIVYSLNMWRHYRICKIFELRTDHSGMKYMFGHSSLNARKSKWLEFLTEYDFEINHIIGKENKVDDALNRRVYEIHATTISMYKTKLSDRILEVVKSDQRYVYTKVNLHQGMSQHKFEGYELKEGGILMYKLIFYVPNDQELNFFYF
jgi:hypothetical protein